MDNTISKDFASRYQSVITDSEHHVEPAYDMVMSDTGDHDVTILSVRSSVLKELAASDEDSLSTIVEQQIDRILSDPADRVKREIARAFTMETARFDDQKPYIVEKMIQGLESESAVTRAVCIQVLKEFGFSEANGKLLHLIANDTDKEVRARAAVFAAQQADIQEAFLEMGDKSTQALIDGLDDSESSFQLDAATVLRIYHDPKVRSILIAFAEREDIDPQVREQAQQSIQWLNNKFQGITWQQK